jgi:Domain of unknown function (DUF4407)
MSKPGQFLITLSGARPDILAFCPGERTKFQSLGWVILITAGMAVVSMWFALTSTLGVNAIAAVPVALLWGLVIMGIDRWLVTSMPRDRSRKFLIAIPRLALGLLLGSIISTPFVLRIFAPEINNQVSVIKENNEATFLSSQQGSAVGQRVSKWQTTVNNLQAVIDSHGAQPINPSSDPVIQGLTTELTSERQTAAADYKAWQCQLYGGCGAPKGSGPLAQASEKRYNDDEAQIASLTSQISARKQALQASDAASQTTRLQQAKSALPAAQAQLSAARSEQDSLLSGFQQTNGAANGLLIKLEALDQLSAKGGSLSAARWLLFLFFLVIELLPVSVKLMQQPGLYEQILDEKDRYELREAKWRLRSAAGVEPGGRVPGLSTRAQGFLPRPPGRQMSTGELRRLFEQRTQTVAPPPSPAYQDPLRGSTPGPDGFWPGGSGNRPAGDQGRVDEQLSRVDEQLSRLNGDSSGARDYGKHGYRGDEEQSPGARRVYSDEDL